MRPAAAATATTVLLPPQASEQLWAEQDCEPGEAASAERTTGARPPYLLQAEHQRASALEFIRLPGAAQRLLDDVPEVIVELQQRQEEVSPSPRGQHRSFCLIPIV